MESEYISKEERLKLQAIVDAYELRLSEEEQEEIFTHVSDIVRRTGMSYPDALCLLAELGMYLCLDNRQQ